MRYEVEQVAKPVVGKKEAKWGAVVSCVKHLTPDSDDSIFVPIRDGQAEGISTLRGMSTSIAHAVREAGMVVTTAEGVGRIKKELADSTEWETESQGIRIWRLRDSAGAGGAARVAAQQQRDGAAQVGKRTW